MLRRAVVLQFCVLLVASSVFGAGRAEVETTFRQGANRYAGCQVIDPWKTVIKGERGTINRYRIVFGELKLAGKDVKIASAELRVKFIEEGWSRIPNAELEIYDAAEKDGKPLDVVKYRKHKVVGMDLGTKFVTWKVPATLVARWIERPQTNKGIRFKFTPDRKGRFQMIFGLHHGKIVEDRPALVVKYSFTGEAPPFTPEITTNVGGKIFGPKFTVTWKKKSWDPNGTPVTYEVALGPKDGAFQTIGKIDAEKCTFDVDTRRLPTDKSYCVRLRAVDPTDLASDWVVAKGEFRVSRKEYVVWTQNSVTKVHREENPPTKMTPATLAGARNEYESFQVVVSGLSSLKDVDVKIGDLAGPGGAKISRKAFRLWRVHYVDCKGQGWLPDSMVPWHDPWNNKRIGGKFGAPFAVSAGTNGLVWVELHVPEDAKPGDYKGSVEVTVAGKPARTIPLSVTVWPVTLPKTTTLLTYFELSRDTLERHCLHALHKHRIDVWKVVGHEHKLKWKDGKPVIRWSAEFDGVLDDYFSGLMFEDGLPGKSALFGVSSWDISLVLQGKSDENRIEILKQYQEHYKDKPYVSKMAWFFIDEPKPETIAKCVRVGKQIKKYSPSIRLLLTTKYHKELEGLVDIWDPIIPAEIGNWNVPSPDVYRAEKKKGRTIIACVTCNSAATTTPNLYIYHRAMQHRIWSWMAYCLDLDGIEWWDSKAAPSVLVPKNWRGGLWGSGSFFYRGTREELGIRQQEIALPSIRLKMLRDGIEDHELLSMLRKKDPELARKMCHRMAQETKDYDKSFAKPVQHVSWNWNTDGKGNRKMPGYYIWESSPERLAETRAAIAKALAD